MIATDKEVSDFQSWYNPEDFGYSPYFLDNDESVVTFNALERLFSENLLDLPIDLTTFRGFPNPKRLYGSGSLSSVTDWLSEAPPPAQSESESDQREQDLSFAAAFLAQLEEGRREFSHQSVERSLLLEHEAALKEFSRAALPLVDPS